MTGIRKAADDYVQTAGTSATAILSMMQGRFEAETDTSIRGFIAIAIETLTAIADQKAAGPNLGDSLQRDGVAVAP